MGHNVSTSSKGVDGSCNSNLNSGDSDNPKESLSADREFATSHDDDARAPTHSAEDLSSSESARVSLLSKELKTDRGGVSEALNIDGVGSSREGTRSAPSVVAHNAESAGEKQDGRSSSSSSVANQFSDVAKEATVAIQRPLFCSSTDVQSEPFRSQSASEPFVFGASRQSSTKTTTHDPLSTPFKFTAKASPLFPSPSSTEENSVSTNAKITVSELLSSQHKGSSVNSQVDTDGVVSSFSCFNLGALKPSVKSGVVSSKKIPTTIPSFASFEKLEVEVDSDGDYSSSKSAASHFVFSAGCGAAAFHEKVSSSDRDNSWAGVKIDSANETENAASGSTPSVGSSSSGSGWGHFTFTAESSKINSSATLLLRRHAPRNQRNIPAVGAADVSKCASTKVEEETVPSTSAEVKQVIGSESGSVHRLDDVEPTSARSAATEQLCERWRLRGNKAYTNGDYSKAEKYYSRVISSVPPNETSQSCIRASMLCYSNLAATRMVVGRMREALADCMCAISVDPNFLRARLRAAICHLALGEIEPAVKAFRECIRRAKEESQPDMKVASQASERLEKALQVEDYLNRASGILASWSSGDTPTAVRLLNEALLSSPHSERALELKSRGLLLLQRYDEVVQLCEQSLVTAQLNHPSATEESLHMWRWQVIVKAKYNLGRLEETRAILQKLDKLASAATADRPISTGNSPNGDPLALSITGIRDSLHHKAAGDKACQIGKHAEAVEHYSAALICYGDSRPLIAVCFCSRGAASEALGNIADAIADCSRAIVLDPKYAKAISRRATLHEKVRDYSQSCHDLRRLVTLLEAQQHQERVLVSSGRVGKITTNAQQDLRQARDRLAKAEDEREKGHPLDHYMILGLEPSCSSDELKKAYRKAALRHHPDKAVQFLTRSEAGDDGGLWKGVADEVRQDAERLFKLIGEANAILSDTQKRTRYDTERKLRMRTGSGVTGGFSEMHRSTERGQRNVGRRPPQGDFWNGNQHGSNNRSRSKGDGGPWTDFIWDAT